jgi:hypothetical protein
MGTSTTKKKIRKRNKGWRLGWLALDGWRVIDLIVGWREIPERLD